MGRAFAAGAGALATFALALNGCGSSGAIVPGTAPETRVISTPGGTAAVTIDDQVKRNPVASDPERVLRALLATYEAWGLDPDWLDPEQFIVGITRIDLQGTLDGKPLSHFFQCGRNSVRADYADESRVQVSAVSTIVPDEVGSMVETIVEAVAHPLSAGGGQWHECVSTGELESALVASARRLLGG